MEKGKNKRYVAPKIFSCRICGDFANDHMHFGASFCCMSCKAFFRRSVKNSTEHPPCNFGNKCVINVQNRTLCPACRYKECLNGGMGHEKQ